MVGVVAQGKKDEWEAGEGEEEGRKQGLDSFSWPDFDWVQLVFQYLVKQPGRQRGEILVKGVGTEKAFARGLASLLSYGAIPDSSKLSSPPGNWELFEESWKLKNKKNPPFIFLSNRN